MQKIILTRGQKDLLYDGNVMHTAKESFFLLPHIFMCRDGGMVRYGARRSRRINFRRVNSRQLSSLCGLLLPR